LLHVPASPHALPHAPVQILMGLNHMHSKKILHRDIKTLNVFLDQDLNVKLGDMGVAKVCAGVADELQHRSSQYVVALTTYCAWDLRRSSAHKHSLQRRLLEPHTTCRQSFVKTNPTMRRVMCGLWELFCMSAASSATPSMQTTRCAR
jgi:serine/threonine protein kinase